MKNTCRNCKTVFETEVKFCSNCGIALSKSLDEKKVSSLNLIITFYVAFLLFSTVSYFLYETYPNSFAVDLGIEFVFALLVLVFSAIDFKEILKLYRFPTLDWKIYLFTIVFPVISALVVYFSIDQINTFFSFEESLNYYLLYIDYQYPFLWSFIFVAIFPPIFEELAFRGFLFNQLKKVTSDNLTIVATAFIFALIHFSFISFLWIFPFGLILGYLRNRYLTLWLGIIIHFMHNFIVVLIDYYQVNLMA